MPSNIIYSLSPIKINSTVLAVENIGLPQDVAGTMHQHSGNEFPTLNAIYGANPKLTFRTPFAGAYALFGLSALACTTVEVYLAKFSSLVRAGTTSHPKLALAASASAYGHITGWSVNQDGILMADCELFYLSADGTTHPISAPSLNQTLPSLASQPLLHTLGPVSFNGTVYGGLNQAACQLGQQVTVQRSDGCLYPYLAARTGAQPKLTGDHLDPIALLASAVLGYVGTNITANVVQYYRAYDSTTGLNSGSNCVSVTIASGRVNPTAMEASQGAVAKTGFEVNGLSSSSTNPLVIATNASAPAIP
jgi:hypothetical protein